MKSRCRVGAWLVVPVGLLVFWTLRTDVPRRLAAADTAEQASQRSDCYYINVTRHVIARSIENATVRQEHAESIETLAWNELPFCATSGCGNERGRIGGVINRQEDGTFSVKIVVERAGNRETDRESPWSQNARTSVVVELGKSCVVSRVRSTSSLEPGIEWTEESVLTVTAADPSNILRTQFAPDDGLKLN